MQEDLLQFIWQHGLFNSTALQTTEGISVSIESPGTLNTLSGPDFSNCRVVVGPQRWAGNIEIHVRSSEWQTHRHHLDPAYRNVVLHVVFEDDKPVENEHGERLPTIELRGRIPHRILEKHQQLRQSKSSIPCASQIGAIPKVQFNTWLDRLCIQRLERKCADLELIFSYSNSDWLETLYVQLIGYFGQGRNKLAFQELGRTIRLKTLLRYGDDQLKVEALLFGAAGLLPSSPSSEYEKNMVGEFDFLTQKHDISRIGALWKFGGLRPANFPTRRIAMLAGLISKLESLNEAIISKGRTIDLQSDVSPYWRHHYNFGVPTSSINAVRVSSSFRNTLIINVFAPYLFFYGQQTGSNEHKDRAVALLSSAKRESNSVVKKWEKLEIVPINGSESQALIELSTQYCDHKKCVLCNIGKQLINKR